MKSLKQGAGYVMIDHRDSPGLTAEDVAKWPKAVPVPKGKLYERDHKTCSHCSGEIIFLPLRKRPRGYCPKCHAILCDTCEGIRIKTGNCFPMAKMLDEEQRRLEQFVGQPDHPDNKPLIQLTDWR